MNLALMTPFPWHVSPASTSVCASVEASNGKRVAFCDDYRAAELIVGMAERIEELEQQIETLEDKKKEQHVCINQMDAKFSQK